MDKKNFFAVDLGATSGRTIVGTLHHGALELRELTRFPNHIVETGGHLYWDLMELYRRVIEGLQTAAREGIELTSVGIDTWGVDFALFGDDGALLRAPYCYRDQHTVPAMQRYLQQIPREQVYGLTGIQFMNFNSLYQLYALGQSGNSALKAAKNILFLPDALSYMLTGKMVTEYTIASTSQFLNPRTKELEASLLEPCGVSLRQFAPMVYPGTQVGTLTGEVQRLTGLGALPVVAVAGHDTASAVASVPARDKNFAYLSSGTWSLMGVELDEPCLDEAAYAANFTNEGGVEGTTRFLKNICGMWILESCRRESPELAAYSYPQLCQMAMQAPAFATFINPDAPCFASPASMLQAIGSYCEATGQQKPHDTGSLMRCIFESLAMRYRQVFALLQKVAPFAIERLHIIGGGSKNDLLNQFTANAIGVTVEAGPVEATAIGNVMLQARAAGLVESVAEMRRTIAAGLPLVQYTPQESEAWAAAYEKYLSHYREEI